MKIVLLSAEIPKGALRELEKRGFYPILLPPEPKMTDAIASHPDSLIFKCKNELFARASYCEAAMAVFSDIREYCSVKLNFTADEPKKSYPEDARLNSLSVENRIFANTATVSKSILDFARENKIEVCHTNQGYPACSTLLLNENAAITADRALADALRKRDIEVTLISAGGISLPPYEYGFIGGASGVYGNEVFFLGNIETHPDAEKIKAAIARVGKRTVSLLEGGLVDLGGMIFLD